MQGLWLAGVIGIAMTALVLGFAGPIVELLGGTGAVIAQAGGALVYLRLITTATSASARPLS